MIHCEVIYCSARFIHSKQCLPLQSKINEAALSQFYELGISLPESGNMPVVKEQLKILQIEMQIKSAHSRISFADILSRPVAFDLLSLILFNCENT